MIGLSCAGESIDVSGFGAAAIRQRVLEMKTMPNTAAMVE
jgi:hypothetical protein